ncbi:MAG: hypothetical protein ACPG4B_01340 [Cycloclasticus sp.]
MNLSSALSSTKEVDKDYKPYIGYIPNNLNIKKKTGPPLGNSGMKGVGSLGVTLY